MSEEPFVEETRPEIIEPFDIQFLRTEDLLGIIAGERVDVPLEVSQIRRMTRTELSREGHLSPDAAERLMAAVEIARRSVALKKVKDVREYSQDDLIAFLINRYGSLEQESFVAVSLDARGFPRDCHTLWSGTQLQVDVDLSALFSKMLRDQAVAFVVSHCHPSGVPTPSPADFRLTQRIALMGQAIGVPLADHVIVADRESFSFDKAGLMKKIRTRAHNDLDAILSRPDLPEEDVTHELEMAGVIQSRRRRL